MSSILRSTTVIRSMSSKKRTLDSFFTPISYKKMCPSEPASQASSVASAKPTPSETANSELTSVSIDFSSETSSIHPTYPFPISSLPIHIATTLSQAVPSNPGKSITTHPNLDLVYFQPYILPSLSQRIFQFLRRELFFYRVQYKITRGGQQTEISSPRYTTVFGVDETTLFDPTGNLIDSKSHTPIPSFCPRYKNCAPRPLPSCLQRLLTLTEFATGANYNFCLVNYYASGNDSISYHSDDESFLGNEPAIASLSLGAKRDFRFKPKPVSPPLSSMGGNGSIPAQKGINEKPERPLKFPLASGDMILMRGPTQANWLHSIPKRKGEEAEQGRINITFRKALIRQGTENYYCYNVGKGEVWKWDERERKMREWKELTDRKDDS